MASKSELLELARRMEREDGAFTIFDARDRDVGEGIEQGSHEWRVIIDALRVAAASL